ncbi:MAG TPA: 5-oxoprolinase subunit PxpB, partial [Gemmatimonadales bacterium]|nr:5-oxoprolinase subunit PxpB [Gemmatimonadales bacterium]
IGRTSGVDRPTVLIPVRYDGPDLEEVSARTSLTREEVIRRHTAPEYLVYLLGFAPGFGYLGDLDPALILPRRSAPRTRVPAGSVAIAGAQTAVYPLETPGGWHLIGRTTLSLFDPRRDPPALLAPGDRVRFEALE